MTRPPTGWYRYDSTPPLGEQRPFRIEADCGAEWIILAAALAFVVVGVLVLIAKATR